MQHEHNVNLGKLNSPFDPAIYTVRRIRYGALLSAFWIYCSFQVFTNYPHLQVFFEAGVVMSALGFTTVLAIAFLGHGKMSLFSFYIFVIATWFPFQLAASAASYWGQPMIYGILTRRGDILVLSVAVLNELTRTGRLDVRDVIRGLLMLGWISAVVFGITVAFFDPLNFQEYRGFAGGAASGSPSFHFSSHLLVFLVYFYWISARLKFGFKNKVLFALLTVILFYVGVGRSSFIAILFGFLLAEYQMKKLGGFVLSVLFTITIFILVFISFSVVAPEQLQAITEPLRNAFTVVLLGTETGDISADSRILQTILAWPVISENWLFGTGFLSAQWQGGFSEQFGYFYPSDIGLFGVLLVYGLFGVGIYFGVPYFAWKHARCASCRMNSLGVPYIAGVAWLGYAFSMSLSTGYFIFQPAGTLFFVFFVGAIRRATLRPLRKGKALDA